MVSKAVKIISRIFLASSIACVLFLSPHPASATSIIPANLEEMTLESALVFRGRCLSARSEILEEKYPCSVYRFRVIETLRGKADKEVTIRQFGVRQKDMKKFPSSFRVDGMPEYEPGGEYVLFLTKESPVGLRAPHGLGLGGFGIFPRDGKPHVMNSANNANLFLDTSITPERREESRRRRARQGVARRLDDEIFRGPILYDDLKKEVNNILKGQSLDVYEANRRYREKAEKARKESVQ